MKTDVEIVRGTTNTFEITVTNAFGQLYELTENEKLLFGVKKNHTDSTYIVIKTVESGKNGVYTVTLQPEDTELCDCCKYYYDVAIQSGNDFYNIIEASSFHVKKNITCWGCDSNTSAQPQTIFDSEGYMLKDSEDYVLQAKG